MTAAFRASNSHPVLLVAGVTFLGWLGETIHNWVELANYSLLRPENSLTLLVSALLFVGWLWLPWPRLTAALLLVWGLLHLVGGALISVLPLAFLPFEPEQSLGHYASHVFYGLAQLPLLWVMARHFRSGGVR